MVFMSSMTTRSSVRQNARLISMLLNLLYKSRFRAYDLNTTPSICGCQADKHGFSFQAVAILARILAHFKRFASLPAVGLGRFGPSFTPRALRAPRAAFVRSEVRSRSNWLRAESRVNTRRPVAVVVSILSVRDTRSAPCRLRRSAMISMSLVDRAKRDRE